MNSSTTAIRFVVRRERDRARGFTRNGYDWIEPVSLPGQSISLLNKGGLTQARDASRHAGALLAQIAVN